MDNIKGAIVGTVITLVVGGTVYTISQEDVIKNFASDTGLTQEQAMHYIDEITEDQLATWDEIGSDMINESQELLNVANEIDCVNYEYEWESLTLACSEGKMQINKLAEDLGSLGQSYVKLGSDSAAEGDMREAIRLIDQLNSSYHLEIVSAIIDQSIINEEIKTNSYNKALLQTVLEGD